MRSRRTVAPTEACNRLAAGGDAFSICHSDKPARAIPSCAAGCASTATRAMASISVHGTPRGSRRSSILCCLDCVYFDGGSATSGATVCRNTIRRHVHGPVGHQRRHTVVSNYCGDFRRVRASDRGRSPTRPTERAYARGWLARVYHVSRQGAPGIGAAFCTQAAVDRWYTAVCTRAHFRIFGVVRAYMHRLASPNRRKLRPWRSTRQSPRIRCTCTSTKHFRDGITAAVLPTEEPSPRQSIDGLRYSKIRHFNPHCYSGCLFDRLKTMLRTRTT